MIDYQLFHFASAPRTATTWIRQAAHMAGLPESGRTEVHKPFDDAPASVLKVSCVRHPCSWLLSYYTSIRPGLVDVASVDCLYADNNTSFDDFVRRYLKDFPGQVGRVFATYGADVCLRVEDLPWAFVELLESMGVPRKLRERCLVLNEQNITKPSLLPRWSPSLMARVLDAEQDLIQRYDY